jgi:hypothetical protein
MSAKLAEKPESGGRILLDLHYTMLSNQKQNSNGRLLFRYNLKFSAGKQMGQK